MSHPDPTRPLTEAVWQSHVLGYARSLGWAAYHTRFSVGSDTGWPDLVLCRPPRLLFVELKSDKGRVSEAQQAWLDRLLACGAEAFVWRPRDRDAVLEALR